MILIAGSFLLGLYVVSPSHTVLFFLCVKSAMEADESDWTQPSNATVLTTVSMEQERKEEREDAIITSVVSGSEDMVGKEGPGVEEGREGEEGDGRGEMDPGKEGIRTEAAVVKETIGEASITFEQVTIHIIINDLYLRE